MNSNLWKHYVKEISSGIVDKQIVDTLIKNNKKSDLKFITDYEYLSFHIGIDIPLFGIFYFDDDSYLALNEVDFVSFLKRYFQYKLNMQYPQNQKLIKSLLTLFNYTDSFENYVTVLDLFIDHKQSFKNNNILTLITKNDSLESLQDDMRYIINNYKVEQIIKQLFSKKYRHLISPIVKSQFMELIQIGQTKHDIKNNIMVKIALIKNANSLEKFISDYIKSLDYWNMDNYIQKAKDVNAKYHKLPNNSFLIEIDDYQQMKQLGSHNWCIQKDKQTFYQYVKEYSFQYIYCDFNLPPNDYRSMIGYTVHNNYSVIHSHYKNDMDAPKQLSESIYKLINQDNDKVVYERLKEDYLSQDFFFVFMKKLMEFDNQYYDEVKNTFLTYINNNPQNRSRLVSYYSVLSHNNYNEEKLIELFKDITLIFNQQHDDFWWDSQSYFNFIRQHQHLPNLISTMINYFNFILKHKTSKESFEPIFIDLINISCLKVEHYIICLNYLKENHKYFNKLLSSQSMQANINIAIRKNPIISEVFNKFYGVNIF